MCIEIFINNKKYYCWLKNMKICVFYIKYENKNLENIKKLFSKTKIEKACFFNSPNGINYILEH
jgi:hypothetical protein